MFCMYIISLVTIAVTMWCLNVFQYFMEVGTRDEDTPRNLALVMSVVASAVALPLIWVPLSVFFEGETLVMLEVFSGVIPAVAAYILFDGVSFGAFVSRSKSGSKKTW